MHTEPRTIGEKVARDGYALVMVRVAELASALRHVPIGEWDYTFATDPRWRVCANGGQQAEWWPPNAGGPVRRFDVYVQHDGMPIGYFNAAGGTFIHGTEDNFLQALDREIRHAEAWHV